MYADLDDGSGVCKHYDAETKRCKIYAERPLHCNVDRFYEMFLRDKMTREEYYELNYAVCRRLQAEANR